MQAVAFFWPSPEAAAFPVTGAKAPTVHSWMHHLTAQQSRTKKCLFVKKELLPSQLSVPAWLQNTQLGATKT